MNISQSLMITRTGRFALITLVCLALMTAGLQKAEAGSRRARVGVAIGAGILGTLILNETTKSERAARERPYRERDSESSGRRRSRHKYSNQDRDDDRAPKKKKVRSVSRSASRKAGASESATAAVQPTEQEKTAPGANESAVTTVAPEPASRYEGDRNAATNTRLDNDHLPEADNRPTASQVPNAAEAISTPGEIKAAQEHLKYLGFDVPAVTGYADARTKIAVTEFQRSIGAPETGSLTVEQLQVLFNKAAAQTAKTR